MEDLSNLLAIMLQLVLEQYYHYYAQQVTAVPDWQALLLSLRVLV